jgi:hypothetical protein
MSSGAPFSQIPIDPVNQTSSNLFYTYTTDGSTYEVTCILESQKYKTQFEVNPQNPLFPGVVEKGNNLALSELYNSNGLVGYWPLNEGSGTIAIDQSGNNNNGTWSGKPSSPNSTYYGAGKIGNYAGWFDGTDNYINVPSQSSLMPTGAFTVSAWIKASYATTTYFGLVTKYAASGCGTGSCGYDLGSYSNHLATFNVRSGSNGNSSDAYSSGVIDNGAWHFVAGVFTGSQVLTYSDGVAGTSVSWSYPSASSSAPFNIGSRAGRSFGGLIDDARIYNRALSQAEIQAIYNAQK